MLPARDEVAVAMFSNVVTFEKGYFLRSDISALRKSWCLVVWFARSVRDYWVNVACAVEESRGKAIWTSPM